MAAQSPFPTGGQLSNPGDNDPLAQLRDLHLPAPIETWPPAHGWIILALIAIAATVYLTYRLSLYWRKNQYRREGMRALTALKANYEHNADAVTYLEQYNQLLKRVALSLYQREDIASLTGEAWVAFLDRSGATKEFSMGAGQILIEGNYGTPSQLDSENVDIKRLHNIASLWIKQHKPEPLR